MIVPPMIASHKHRRTVSPKEGAPVRVVLGGGPTPSDGGLFHQFSLLTGLKVVLHGERAWFNGQPFSDIALKKYVPAYVDRDARTAHVYSGPVRRTDREPGDETLVARVTGEAFRSLSPEELFPASRKEVMRKNLFARVDTLTRPLVEVLFGEKSDFAEARRIIEAHPVQLKDVAFAMLEVFHFPVTEFLQDSLAKSLQDCIGNVFRLGLKAGDTDVLKSNLVLGLSAAEPKTVLPIGKTGADCFRKLGYPELDLHLYSESILKYIRENKLNLEQFISRFVDGLGDPLCVVWDNRNGKSVFVYDFGGQDFFAIGLENPSKAVKRAVDGELNGRNILRGSCYRLYAYSVAQDIRHGKLMFAREERDRRFGFVTYPVTNLLGKRIEAGSPTVIKSASSIQPLINSVAKIMENFRNPKLLDDNFDPVRAYREKLASYQMELAETERLRETVPSPESSPAPLRLSDRFPMEIISKSSASKLEKAGIRTYRALLEAGGNFLLSLTDKATVTKLEAHLGAFRRTLFPRQIAPKPAAVEALPSAKRREAILKDFSVAMSNLPDNLLDQNLLTPIDIDGRYLTGQAGLHLLVKSASYIERWGREPVFVTGDYLQNEGFTARQGADPVHTVDSDGNLVTYYHIQDTDMVLTDDVRYRLAAARAAVRCVPVSECLLRVVDACRPQTEPRRSVIPPRSQSASWTLYDGAFEHYGQYYSDKLMESLTDARTTYEAVRVSPDKECPLEGVRSLCDKKGKAFVEGAVTTVTEVPSDGLMLVREKGADGNWTPYLMKTFKTLFEMVGTVCLKRDIPNTNLLSVTNEVKPINN